MKELGLTDLTLAQIVRLRDQGITPGFVNHARAPGFKTTDLVWVLDPRTLTLRAYPRGASPVLLHQPDTATADPHVPGFSCRVADFFTD